jgi:hypothetical protein
LKNFGTETKIREFYFVYQDTEGRLFEYFPEINHLTSSWTANYLQSDTRFSLYITVDGKTIIFGYPDGKRTIDLVLPLFQPGDRKNLRIQVAPDASFTITELTLSQE